MGRNEAKRKGAAMKKFLIPEELMDSFPQKHRRIFLGCMSGICIIALVCTIEQAHMTYDYVNVAILAVITLGFLILTILFWDKKGEAQ